MLRTPANDVVADASTSAPPEAAKSRVLRLDEVFDTRRMQFVERPTARATKPRSSRSKRNPVLVVRRIFDRRGTLTGTKIEIMSEPLVLVLSEVSKDNEDIELNAVPPKTTSDMLFHYRVEIQEALCKAEQEPESNPQFVADLKVTVDFIHEEYSRVIENMESLTRAGGITWDLLWTLFKPGCLVYRFHTLTEQRQILRFRSMIKLKDRTTTTRTTQWRLSCDFIADDGYKFGRAHGARSLSIDQFEGTRNIAELSVFPLNFHPSADEVCDEILDRGRRFQEMKPRFYGLTSGAAVKESSRQEAPVHTMEEPGAAGEETKAHTYGRAMVDISAYRKFNPFARIVPNVYETLDRNQLTETELLIISPIVYGFCFGTKEWLGLPLSRLEPIVFDSSSINDLVIDESYKNLVLALVKQHNTANDEFDDIVRGKGKGTICLLSGPPGCGKTLTAELAAEATGRPIYQVTAGELGILPSHVDATLTRVLNLAHTWNAILLLDEADVFLAERDAYDINRNALVSVFLRQLEYYQGILILTTNRINHCDLAFESRIHLSLRYKELDEAARTKVWKQFLGRAAQASRVERLDISEADIKSLADREVNGRQIKNVVSAARALAREAGQLLSLTHLNTVLDTMLAWKDERNETKKFPSRTNTLQTDLLLIDE